ncbi:hypothetical protein F2Q68_00008468 [Brassica cretica]|uniref:DNA primase large subunit n=1 Tax=Brassica cretica TaxID=69181 RepID=A0A8S9KQZ5_BRACR|nr:hypothetical protein F2Q68_00008468 [Brassica cretica]
MDDLVDTLWKEHMRDPDASVMFNKDIISHFVLRLVYCRSDELKKWFLSMETALFRHRFRLQNFEAQRAIVGEFGLPYKAVTGAELEGLKERLGQVVRSLGQISPTVEAVYYKVPFEEVPDLVASRRVLIQKGYAFVAGSQLVSLVVTQFRSHISKALILTNRKWTTTIQEREKDRLTPIVEALSTSYLGPDYSQSTEYAEISLKDIDQVAKSSFPLCMRHLFEKVREDHHLKHGGRMQLGLFLKGVGLKLDDALAFWRAEFTKKVGSERFDKEYAYSIRHNYGKEGKRTDYTPYACQKIILSAPGAGDHHGCPYRHFRKWMTTIREREKDRLTPIVEALSTTYVGPDYSQSSDYADISLKDIDQVSKSSFPLCMRHLYEKGVGLKLDDALAFWRAEFSKKVGSERFDKEYAYGIRHNYGKEGKRTDYTPYACQKIISSAPGVGDHHGCPYRHFSEDNLRAALGRMGLSSRGMEDVMDKVRNKHYQLACTLTFEAVYGTSCDVGINHPNQYFEESRKILKSKTPAAPV